jgi:hypothetical protein
MIDGDSKFKYPLTKFNVKCQLKNSMIAGQKRKDCGIDARIGIIVFLVFLSYL